MSVIPDVRNIGVARDQQEGGSVACATGHGFVGDVLMGADFDPKVADSGIMVSGGRGQVQPYVGKSLSESVHGRGQKAAERIARCCTRKSPAGVSLWHRASVTVVTGWQTAVSTAPTSVRLCTSVRPPFESCRARLAAGSSSCFDIIWLTAEGVDVKASAGCARLPSWPTRSSALSRATDAASSVLLPRRIAVQEVEM